MNNHSRGSSAPDADGPTPGPDHPGPEHRDKVRDFTASPQPPEVTSAMRTYAHAHPGQQLYVVDPEFDPDGEVPGWGVRGFYPITTDGTVEQNGWVGNPQYRPGPLTRGWTRPHNPVDRALQLVAAGHQPDTTLLAALADAELLVPTAAGQPDQIPVLADDTGHDTVAIFTAAEHLDPATPRLTVRLDTLRPLLPTVTVVINPGRTPSLRIPGPILTATPDTTK